MSTTRERTEPNVTKLEAGAVVHAQARSGLTAYRVLFCNGQAVSMMVGTSADVTCARCLRIGYEGARA